MEEIKEQQLFDAVLRIEDNSDKIVELLEKLTSQLSGTMFPVEDVPLDPVVETEEDYENKVVSLTDEERNDLDNAMTSGEVINFRGRRYQHSESDCACSKCALQPYCSNREQGTPTYCRMDPNHNFVEVQDDTVEEDMITPEEWAILDNAMQMPSDKGFVFRGHFYQVSMNESDEELCDGCALRKLCPSMLGVNEVLCRKDKTGKKCFKEKEDVYDSAEDDTPITPEEAGILDWLQDSRWGCKARIRGKIYRESEWDEGGNCDTCDLRQLCQNRDIQTTQSLCHKNPSKNFVEVTMEELKKQDIEACPVNEKSKLKGSIKPPLLLNFSIDSSKSNEFIFLGYLQATVFWYLANCIFETPTFHDIFWCKKKIGKYTDFAYYYSREDKQKVYNGFVVYNQKTYDALCVECKNLIVEQCQKDKNLGQELIKRNIHIINK